MVYIPLKEEQRKNVEALLGKTYMNKLPKDFNPKMNTSMTSNKSNTDKIDVSILESGKVCKSFLVGKCPYDMFDNTKENLGKCPKLHIEKYKLIYETAKDNGIKMPRDNYLIDYKNELKKFIYDCDQRVAIAEERLDYNEHEKQLLNDLAKDVENFNESINIIENELEIMKMSNVNMSKIIEHNGLLKKYINERDSIQQRYSSTLERLNVSGQQKLQVCKICGAYMMKVDTDKRLVDHYMGKIHLAYVELRNSLEELETKYKNNA
jgi:hypothetical protein